PLPVLVGPASGGTGGGLKGVSGVRLSPEKAQPHGNASTRSDTSPNRRLRVIPTPHAVSAAAPVRPPDRRKALAAPQPAVKTDHPAPSPPNVRGPLRGCSWQRPGGLL